VVIHHHGIFFNIGESFTHVEELTITFRGTSVNEMHCGYFNMKLFLKKFQPKTFKLTPPWK
jgi:hypothetical protein